MQTELEKRQANQIKKIDFLFLLEMAISAKKFSEEERSENDKNSQDNAEYCKSNIFFILKHFIKKK